MKHAFKYIFVICLGLAACDAGDMVSGGSRARERQLELGVPTVCLNALDRADEVIDQVARAFGIVADIFGAASRFDVDTMDRLSTQLDAITPIVLEATNDYRSAASACRAEA